MSPPLNAQTGKRGRPLGHGSIENEELNPLVLANPAKLYKLLFDCTAQTLIEFARQRLGGDPGITAVLHTWAQKLDFHPHTFTASSPAAP